MGILDNIAKRVAEQITKATPDATPIPSWQMNQQLGYGNATALERDPRLAGVPFSPGNPLIPGAINPVRDDGRADPRRWEFQVAQNINITETRLVPFKTLRAAADQIDILRRCIEVLKSKMASLDWDIVLSNDAIEAIITESGLPPIRAQQAAKEKFNPQIARAREFWRIPDLQNGLTFGDWLNMALEDILVLDAWAVWPQKNVGGQLHGFQILDGSTIKPLIDDRGMRPMPPMPAFQQILYGFPRSEFSASIDSKDADGEFTSDDLSYFVRNRRANSIYGYSPVERSLSLADLYLRRQQWLRAEYTDGVTPELIIKTDATFGGNADLLRAYENILNDDLSGITEQRKRARILPQGLDPIQLDGYGEKFKDVLDKYIVESICGHFGVMPSEIGFSPNGGLGGAGWEEGQTKNSEVVGLMPLATWLGRMLTHLSQVYLGMPRELEFRFQPSGHNDDAGQAGERNTKINNGTMTRNEARSLEGLPLIDSPVADQATIVTGTGVFALTDDGLVNLIEGGTTDSVDGTTDTTPEGEPKPDTDKPEEKPAEEDKEETVEPEEEPKLEEDAKKFDESQPRDENGRFSSDGESGNSNIKDPMSDTRYASADKQIDNINSRLEDKIRTAELLAPNHVSTPGLQEKLGNAKNAAEAVRSAKTPEEKYQAAWRWSNSAIGIASALELIGSQTSGNGGLRLSESARSIDRDARNLPDTYHDLRVEIQFGKTLTPDLDVEETKKFLRFLRKSPNRPFEFKHLPTAYAETLNKFIAIQDYDGARWYAERYLG